MRFRKDKDIIKFIVISLTALLFGIIIFISIQSMSVLGVIFIISGLIGFVITFMVASKPKQDLIEDERSTRVREKAGYSAFIATMMIAAMIPLLQLLKISPSLTPSREIVQVVRDIWIIGLWIFIVSRWYYNKKGDV